MAAVELAIKGGTLELIAAEQRLKEIPGATEKAIKRAAKRTALKGSTSIVKQITKTSNIKSGITKERIKKGGRGKVGQFIRVDKSGRLGIRHFKARWTREGVSYQVEKGGKRLLVGGSFQGAWTTATKIANKKGERLKKPKQVFVPRPNPKWDGNAAVRKGKSRLPIVFLKGVSPLGWFTIKKMKRPNKSKLAKFFNERLRHEIRFILKKKKGK